VTQILLRHYALWAIALGTGVNGIALSHAQQVLAAPLAQLSQATPVPLNSGAVPIISPTILQAIEFDPSTEQLRIRTDRPISYTSRWQRDEYQIILFSAQAANNLVLPRSFPSKIRQLDVTPLEGGQLAIRIRVLPGAQIQYLRLIVPQRLVLGFQPLPIATEVPQPATSEATNAPPPVAPPRLPIPAPQPVIPNSPRATAQRTVVVIDPGHGGPDPGAVGIGRIYEKEIVFDISVQVANLLQQQGVQVLLTRRDDRDLGLEPRVQLANQVRAAAFLSIHANAISLARPDVNGVETFYYYSGGQALAAAIQRQLLADTGMRNRGVKRARFYLLRRAAVPAALVEVGFVTGQEDAPRLADAGFRTQIAIAITRGLLNYLSAVR
jgi:N-acetylmuramoyl-L-alanine amidase